MVGAKSTGVTATAIAMGIVLIAGCGNSSTSGGQATTNQQTGGSAAANTGGSSQLHNMLPDSFKASGTLKFVIQQHPPYTVITGNNAAGPNQDLEGALAKALGVKAEDQVVGGGFTPVAAGILSHRYDIAMGPVSATADHEGQYDIIAWTEQHFVYAVPKDGPVKKSDPLSLCGTSVSFISGSTIGDSAHMLSTYCEQQGKTPLNFVPVADNNSAILAIKSGRAQAAGLTDSQASDAEKQDPSLTTVPQPPAAGGTGYKMGLIVAKDTGLEPALFAAMGTIFKDGTYAKVMKKYNLQTGMLPKPVLNPPPS